MSTPIVNRVVAVLNLPGSVRNLLVFAKAVIKAMTGNANFTASAAKVTQLQTDTAALDAAETALNTKPPTGTTAARDVALEVVKNDLRLLRNEVQTAADAKPAQAEAIIKSSGMSVKKSATRNKRQNTVEDGTESGTVLLEAEGEGAHEWEQSPDGGSTIVHLPATLKGFTTVRNLSPGLKVWFRNRQLLPNDVYAEWSAWISITPRVF